MSISRNGRRESLSRIGLALAGGGPLGVIYEIGALRALDEALEGIDFNDLDIYVGVSAGSVIAANLVNQFTTTQLCRIFIYNESQEYPFNPGYFLTPAFGEYQKRLRSIPKLCWQAARRFIQNPQIGLLESLMSLNQAIPTGIFDNQRIHQFLAQVYDVAGRTNDFRKLKHKLYIVAVDVDTGETVNFGGIGYDHIPISKAVQASTALPGLYSPVEIDGHYYVDGALIKTMHASVALNEGVNLILCLNPIVPFDASLSAQAGIPQQTSLIEGGLPVVLSQTFRSIIHSRLEVSMASYDTQYQNTDIVLFEPNRDDEKMFFANVFSFSNRQWACEHAYQTIRGDLLARRFELEPVLARHGIRLRVDVLEDETRHFDSSWTDKVKSATRHHITRNLNQLLDELQDVIDSCTVRGHQ